jgi:hypothetical protein
MVNTFVKDLIINSDKIFFTIIQAYDRIKIFYPNVKKDIILEKDADDCFKCISHRLTKENYCRIKINQKSLFLHRLIYCLFREDIKNIDQIKYGIVRHLCGGKNCNNSKHLKLGSHEENMFDREMHNRTAYGEQNGVSKLDTIAVMCIRDNENYMPDSYYADVYNVSTETIRRVRQGKTWKHLL